MTSIVSVQNGVAMSQMPKELIHAVCRNSACKSTAANPCTLYTSDVGINVGTNRINVRISTTQ